MTVNRLTHEETADRLPKSIRDCLSQSGYHDASDLCQLLDCYGVEASYNPDNLTGYWPEGKFGEAYAGRWNLPFVANLIHLNHWEGLLTSIGFSELPHADVGTCSVCLGTMFDVRDPSTYTSPGSFDLFMCPNSTKDNYHCVCFHCFSTLITTRVDKFSPNPTCPCCREVPAYWLAMGQATHVYPAHPCCGCDYHLDLTAMTNWLRLFYANLRTSLMIEENEVWAANYVRLEDQLRLSQYRLDKEERAVKTARIALDVANAQIAVLNAERESLKCKLAIAEKSSLLMENQFLKGLIRDGPFTPPTTPSILGHRKRKQKNSVKTTIQEKFRKLAEEEGVGKDDVDEDDLN